MTDSSAVDYRVSRLIVLCKDCGDDVGLYPSRHKCRTPDRPPLPTLVVPKEEQATYWNMLKNTLWSTEGSTTASDESPGGLIWNTVRDATTTVAKVVGVATADESDSDEDENGETKVTRELKAYYEKKGEGIPDFLLTKKSGSRTEDLNRNVGGQTRGRVVKKAPIPIRKAPLREEDDEQEQMRQREREQAEREKEQEERELERERRREKEQTERELERERRRAEKSDQELDEERREDERKRSEREAALAALDGKRSSTSSTASAGSSSRRGTSPDSMRGGPRRADPRMERSPNYNERPPPPRQRPPQAQRRPSPPVNERPRVPVQQPQRYNQQPVYRRAPPPVVKAPPPRRMQPPPPRAQPLRSSAGSGSFAPQQMRPNMPNMARKVDPRAGTARRLGDMDPRMPLPERRIMIDPRQPEARIPPRDLSRNGPRMAAGSQGNGRMNQGFRRDYEGRH